MSRDRRRFTRARATKGLAALLQIDSATTSVVVDNISLGGVFLRSARPVALGTRISMRVLRPGIESALVLAGSVVGILTPQVAKKNGVAPGMRVRFDDVEGVHREKLSALLADLGVPQNEQTVKTVTGELLDDPFADLTSKIDATPSPAPFQPDPVSMPDGAPIAPTGELHKISKSNAVDALPVNTAPDENPFAKRAPGFEVELTLEPEPENEVKRLMLHVRGLLAQLSEMHERQRELEEENDALKQANAALKRGS